MVQRDVATQGQGQREGELGLGQVQGGDGERSLHL